LQLVLSTLLQPNKKTASTQANKETKEPPPTNTPKNHLLPTSQNSRITSSNSYNQAYRLTQLKNQAKKDIAKIKEHRYTPHPAEQLDSILSISKTCQYTEAIKATSLLQPEHFPNLLDILKL
jgi:hypothetical protein